MKIDHLFVQSFLGVVSVDVDTRQPVQLFCGGNGAGKSSLRDAIALALTSDLGRVSLKKDAGQLVRTGDSQAICEVRDADGDAWAVTITAAGKIADSQKGRQADPTLPYVLDAQRFAQLDATERRAFLFGLMGVKLDGAAVAAKLAERGCDAAKSARIAPMLRAGFPAAAEDAKAQATAAKGAWRAVTGETYGAVKAVSWKAPAVAFSQQSLDAALQALAAVDASIAQAQQDLGAVESVAKAVADARGKLAGLKETAAHLVRRKVKLQHDEKSLKDAQDTLDSATAKAGNAPRVGLVHDLARSVDALLQLGAVDRDSVVGIDALQALDDYETEHGSLNAAVGDSQAQGQLPALTQARDLMASAVRNSMRDVKASEDAASQVQLLEQQIAAAGQADAAAVDVARQRLATAQADRKTAAAAVDTLRAAKTAAEGATLKTVQASKHHVDVESWDAIARALEPNGIPAELLSAALGPINARLAQSAADAQWPPVEIGADMAITYGGRAYGLISESEQWRADAMLAEAIASQSSWRLLLLDRFDVLDLPGRADLIAWLDVLAEAGEVDSVFLFGTLKAEPTNLPASIGTHWIDSGMAAQHLKEAA
jgi:hypothetical protein